MGHFDYEKQNVSVAVFLISAKSLKMTVFDKWPILYNLVVLYGIMNEFGERVQNSVYINELPPLSFANVVLD